MIRLLITSLALLLLLASCGVTTGTSPVKTKKPAFVTGTYTPGSNLTEPRPRESKFLKTEHAGFVVLEKGAAYYLHARVIQPRSSPIYIRVEYENPRDNGQPFVNDMELPPSRTSLTFSSPDVVSGIRNYGSYTIRATIYENRKSTTPIDTLVQPVRAYVDTTTSEVRVFNGMRPR